MKPFIVHDVDQRSDEWRAFRLGRLTGSRAGAILATIQKGEAAGRRNLRLALVLERLTNRSQESDYVSAAMAAGIEREADARATYEAITGRLVQCPGFLSHPDLMAGCSLDGQVDDFTRLLSIKCRQPAAHLEFLQTGKVPAASMAQIRHELWITGAGEHEYFSWNPDFPETMQSRTVTVYREDADIPGYDKAARAFLEEVDRELAALQGWSVLEQPA